MRASVLVVYVVVVVTRARGIDGRRPGLTTGDARECQGRLEGRRRPGCHGRIGQSRAMRQVQGPCEESRRRLIGELMRRSCQAVHRRAQPVRRGWDGYKKMTWATARMRTDRMSLGNAMFRHGGALQNRAANDRLGPHWYTKLPRRFLFQSPSSQNAYNLGKFRDAFRRNRGMFTEMPHHRRDIFTQL